MKNILILGAGTGGTMMANRLSEVMKREIDEKQVSITIVDENREHVYQPGLLFVPFGIYKTKADLVKPRDIFLPKEASFIVSKIQAIDPENKKVVLNKGTLSYDVLIIASGSRIVPEENEGLQGANWKKSIFDFYTMDGAFRLHKALRGFTGGRLVVNIAEMPIKCPVAPPEITLLSDWYLRERGLREKTEIVYTTPLSGPFTKPKASSTLSEVFTQRDIKVDPEFDYHAVDNEKKVLSSADGREQPFDLLISIPTMMGAKFLCDSELGDELGFVHTDKHTLQSKEFEDVFIIGDATNVPTSKAGSVAHFESEILVENIVRYLDGLEPLPKYDGHSNCFVESGYDKCLLFDFNYEVEPLPGKFPVPGLGPFSLLAESKMNHYGKMMFRWAYWHLLLMGKDLPISPLMSMAGKENV